MRFIKFTSSEVRFGDDPKNEIECLYVGELDPQQVMKDALREWLDVWYQEHGYYRLPYMANMSPDFLRKYGILVREELEVDIQDVYVSVRE